jgi:hypothetical protein
MMEKNSEREPEDGEMSERLVIVNDGVCSIYSRTSHELRRTFHADLSAHHMTMGRGQPAITAQDGRPYLALGHPVMPLPPAVHPP